MKRGDRAEERENRTVVRAGSVQGQNESLLGAQGEAAALPQLLLLICASLGRRCTTTVPLPALALPP